jgi:8-oxo-dGTP diphosphatase
MKDRKEKSRMPILAAGGVVMRNVRTPLFAVVQSRKTDTWGLPKGKLVAGEDAMTAARREVLEETGYCTTIHEFLGTLAYEKNSRHKVVQFWRMEAVGEPAGHLMRDVRAVLWLALEDAISRLTHFREQAFLGQVGPLALILAGQPARPASLRKETSYHSVVPGVPLAPAADAGLSHLTAESETAERQQPLDFETCFIAGGVSGQTTRMEGTDAVGPRLLGAKPSVRKTWSWFRHTTLLHRQQVD